MPEGPCRGGTPKANWKNLFKSVHPCPQVTKAPQSLPVQVDQVTFPNSNFVGTIPQDRA